jgi:antitoxin component YwqK of YwqJK toxin-antitoxin module
MKKFLFIILFIQFITLGLLAQQAERNQTDDKGWKQGYWRKYDEMGHVLYEGQFKNNIPLGEFKYYYPNGSVRAILIMFNDGKESHSQLFHRNGKLMAKGKYFQQKKDSIWNYYSEHDGILLSTEIYIKTVKQGVWKNYYPDAKVAEEFTYENNIRHGSWKQFYTDGSLKLEGIYVNDNKEGVFKMFHYNGNVEVSGFYHNDLKDGLWIEYNDTNKKIKEEEYKMGKLILETEF